MGILVSIGSPQTCRSPMLNDGLRWGMMVSDGECWSPLGHVGLQWVSDKSPIRILIIISIGQICSLIKGIADRNKRWGSNCEYFFSECVLLFSKNNMIPLNFKMSSKLVLNVIKYLMQKKIRSWGNFIAEWIQCEPVSICLKRVSTNDACGVNKGNYN